MMVVGNDGSRWCRCSPHCVSLQVADFVAKVPTCRRTNFSHQHRRRHARHRPKRASRYVCNRRKQTCGPGATTRAPCGQPIRGRAQGRRPSARVPSPWIVSTHVCWRARKTRHQPSACRLGSACRRRCDFASSRPEAFCCNRSPRSRLRIHDENRRSLDCLGLKKRRYPSSLHAASA